jgi:hypothetical protein
VPSRIGGGPGKGAASWRSAHHAMDMCGGPAYPK